MEFLGLWKKQLLLILVMLVIVGCNGSSGSGGDKPDERDTQSPSKPEIVSAPEVSPGRVALSWPAASDNTGVARYKIYRNGLMIAESGETSYIDTAIPAPGNYCYAISAIDEAGNESEQSRSTCVDVPPPPDTEPPSAPSGVSASVTDSGVKITWAASIDNKTVAGYRVFRNGVKISEVTETSLSDSSVSPGTRYCYTVSAFDASGNESAKSVESCVDLPAARDVQPPSVPSGLSSSRSSGTVLLSWSASTDNIAVSGYKIYRNGEYLASSSANAYTDASIIQGKGYCYAVSAYDPSMNESQKSNESCIESLAGKIKWKFPTEYPVNSLVALDSVGTIYAADEKSLYAVSPEGNLKWKFSPEGRISFYKMSSPVIGPDDTIFLPAKTFIYVLNQDGSLRWRYPRIDISDIAVGPDGVMYTTSSYTNNSDNLYGMAINSDGTLKWKTEDYSYKPIIDNNGALYVDGRRSISALNPDGTKRWTYGNINTSFDSPGMFLGKNGAIYYPSAVRGSYSYILGFNLHALTTDGAEKWINTTGNIYSYPVVGNDGRIYATTNDGKIMVLDQDGTQAMLSEYTNFLRCSLSVDNNNTIFAVAEDGLLYALNSDLSVKWRTQTGGPIGSPAIGADGTLYFGSSDGSIYAVYSDSPGLSTIWGRARGDNKNSGCVMSGQKYTGTVNPTVPTNISAPEILPNMVKLEWTPSTGISAPIKGYKIYRDGVFVGLKGNGFTDYGLAESARYSYQISAEDMAGNESNLSEIFTVTTPGFMEGKLKWKRETENLNYPDVVSIGMDGTLYLASSNYFTGFNANGSIKYTSLISSEGTHSYGSLVFSSYLSIGKDGNLYTSGPQPSYKSGWIIRFFTSFTPDGSTRWKYLASPHATSISQAIAADGTIYLGKPSRVDYENAGLIAFNSDGSVKWQYVVADDEYFSASFLAIAQNGTIYAVNNDIYPGLYAIRPDGSLKWEYRISPESIIAGPPAIMPDGTILLVESYGGITALNADGIKKWQALPDEKLNSPVVSQDGVIYASGKSSIVAIKPDGSLKWRYETGLPLGSDALYNRTDINQSPVIASDGTIYLGSTDGWLYAFDKDGSLKWKYSTGSPVLSVTVSQDGTLYFRSGAYFYAMQTSSMGLASGGWPKIYHDNQNTGCVTNITGDARKR